VPPDARLWADLPILMPEVRGMLHPPANVITIFDVGGDEVGSRVLSTFRPDLVDGHYELWQVINSRRPFTGTVDGCLSMQRQIEQTTRLHVTGLFVNSHLIDETTIDVVLEGWRLAKQVSERNGVPIRGVALREALAAEAALREVDAPILRLQRTMLPPWLNPQEEWNGTHRN
jgi:hypothetical protein